MDKVYSTTKLTQLCSPSCILSNEVYFTFLAPLSRKQAYLTMLITLQLACNATSMGPLENR